MLKKIYLILLFPIYAVAAEQWICVEASSQKQGKVISACGIGMGKNENEARLNAFDNAKTEFQRVCLSSDDCKMCLKDKISCSVYGEDSKNCYDDSDCSVIVVNGKVREWEKFKPVYSEDLK